MKQAVLGYLLFIIPKNLLSYLVGNFTSMILPKSLRLWSLRWFAKRYQINVEEAEKPLEDYNSINDFFTRKLKPKCRPIDSGYIHPADSSLTVMGVIRQGELIQAKGKKYALDEFVGGPIHQDLTGFEGGHFLTYYLCPTDYHRVHFPMSGEVVSATHIPGRLWPVNPWSVNHISQLFSINERVVVRLNTERGPLLIVMVGATNVGKITTSFDAKIVSNQGSWKSVLHRNYRVPIEVEKGQELGVFNMGSTVIVVSPKGFFEALPPNGPYQVKIGENFERTKSP